ncbi:unnamed protein product [Microthlaspi erraticum]|uniref:MATH domain-containing protein n=1 Tax=Microthlaspi erraticum TaxID=1685480 RepID=A0A6D2L034_9BRAS|nr:unnamed protein product [Microthlaspi erraticum]
MENEKQTSFTLEIDNFSEKEALIQSPNFLSGGCEWFVNVYPKGKGIDDHLSLFVHVANHESLRLGWRRRAILSFVLLNQSGKELYRKDDWPCKLFCAELRAWGFPKFVPRKQLQGKGFLEKNKLIVKVEIKVVEVVDEGDATGNGTLDYNGFQVLHSQVLSVSWIFVKYPDVAVNVKQKNQQLKTTYMNILLDLKKTLDKHSHCISETELSNAGSDLIDLTEAGFKLDWLKTKLDEVSLERKKSNGGRVQELEKDIKNLNLELNKEKATSASSAAKVSSLEHTVSDLKDKLNMKEAKSCSPKHCLFHSWKADQETSRLSQVEENHGKLNRKLESDVEDSHVEASIYGDLYWSIAGEFVNQIQCAKEEYDREAS